MGKALVAGALGVAGRNLVDHLVAREGWEVVGLSRRRPAQPVPYRHVAVDLLDARACRRALGELADVTHVFYAARAPGATFAEEAATNRRMLVNLLDGLEPAAADLRHVHLVHGTKWYGCQIGPFRTPSREDDPRQLRPCFYYDQQDFIAERQRGKAWTWSSVRPPLVCGFAVGSPHNLLTLIGVYATVCGELGMPLRFPGSRGCYETLYQAVDAGLLAEAMVWAATTEGCANEAFNVTNGDCYRWQHLWPAIADLFGLPAGDVQAISLAGTMPELEPVWDRAVARHRLRPHRYRDLASWAFGDLIFSLAWDDVSSTVKSRRHGFHAVEDTEAMFLRQLAALRRERVIP